MNWNNGTAPTIRTTLGGGGSRPHQGPRHSKQSVQVVVHSRPTDAPEHKRVPTRNEDGHRTVTVSGAEKITFTEGDSGLGNDDASHSTDEPGSRKAIESGTTNTVGGIMTFDDQQEQSSERRNGSIPAVSNEPTDILNPTGSRPGDAEDSSTVLDSESQQKANPPMEASSRDRGQVNGLSMLQTGDQDAAMGKHNNRQAKSEDRDMLMTYSRSEAFASSDKAVQGSGEPQPHVLAPISNGRPSSMDQPYGRHELAGRSMTDQELQLRYFDVLAPSSSEILDPRPRSRIEPSISLQGHPADVDHCLSCGANGHLRQSCPDLKVSSSSSRVLDTLRFIRLCAISSTTTAHLWLLLYYSCGSILVVNGLADHKHSVWSMWEDWSTCYHRVSGKPDVSAMSKSKT